MPKQSIDPIAQEWLNSGFKGLLAAVIAIGIWVFNNNSTTLSKSIEGLTGQLKTMEQHQIETDKKVAAIEVSREINSVGYQKLQSDVQDLKTQIVQLVARTQTIADFVSSNFKVHK